MKEADISAGFWGWLNGTTSLYYYNITTFHCTPDTNEGESVAGTMPEL